MARLAIILLCCLARAACSSGGSGGGSSSSDGATRALHAAARSGDDAALAAALAAGAAIDDVSLAGASRQSPLMAASLGGHASCVSALLAAGADAAVGEKDGYTPLHGAAFQGRAAAASVLLAAGGGRVPRGPHAGDGIWPLQRATWGREPRHAATVKAFLDAGGEGGSPRVRDREGKTPLDHARAHGASEETIRLLEDAEAAEAAHDRAAAAAGGEL